MSIPAWRQRQLADQEAERERRYQERIGDLLGLDVEELAAEPEPSPMPEPEPSSLAAAPASAPVPAAAGADGVGPSVPNGADLGTLAPSAGLVELLPADFPLPALVKFVPNAALLRQAHEAARYALDVTVAGAEGLQRADVALTALRTSLTAITDHFEEPTRVANQLHKRLTGIRAEWCEVGAEAVKTVGARIYTEQQRLQRLADDERRKAQDEANRQAREAARVEAERAAANAAPAVVVEELRQQAETAVAPPVALPLSAPPALKGSTTAKTWKVRLAGSQTDDTPEMADLTPAQRAQVIVLLRAVLDGKAPLLGFMVNWGYWQKRAAAEKGAFDVPGLESYEQGSVRARGIRR